MSNTPAHSRSVGLAPAVPAVPAVPASPGGEAIPGSDRRRRRYDWRVGGRQVYKWDLPVLVVVLVCGGLGVAGASAVDWVTGSRSSLPSTLTLWTGMTAAVVFAFVRARPAGLLRLRSMDLLWGVGLGLGLRLMSGAMSGANARTFPSAGGKEVILASDWWSTFALPSGLVAPVIEETFFRGVLLVVIYQLLRRALGVPIAGVSSLLFVGGAFVVLHGLFSPLVFADALQLLAIAIACGALVLLTGRLWSAVFAHIIYNVSFLMLMTVGTLLG